MGAWGFKRGQAPFASMQRQSIYVSKFGVSACAGCLGISHLLSPVLILAYLAKDSKANLCPNYPLLLVW